VGKSRKTFKAVLLSKALTIAVFLFPGLTPAAVLLSGLHFGTAAAAIPVLRIIGLA
jgi:hypothetical protein